MGTANPSSGKHVVLDKFHYRGFFGRPAWCGLEVLPLRDGRTLAIATELQDNPGTSVTNVAEHLASVVCDRLGIEPDKLVWIEHYSYPPAGGERARTFDLVTFTRRTTDRYASQAVRKGKIGGWPGYFMQPSWRVMDDQDWQRLGIAPRPAVEYEL